MADEKTPPNETTDHSPQTEAEAASLPEFAFDGDGLPEETDEADRPPALPYLVAAVGASAGGVEAYIQVVGALTPDTGVAFVLIPHLLPTRKSHMVEIISRHTQMPVLVIEDGATPKPNEIVIVPPGSQVCLRGGAFHLEPRQDGGRVIDYFFRSLASDQRAHAIGVILSGTDADGALGLKAIKGEGGISLVQRPETAGFPEMPRTSISADHVDKVLSPVEIAAELAEMGRQFRKPVVRNLEDNMPPAGEEQAFARVLNLLRGVSGIDFRLYKPTTIRRRIARRMLLHRFESLSEYAAFLQGNPKELRELQEDALINVTRFFRDPGVYDALKQTILPRIFEEREADQQVRLWVAGCSTGEEVYSIAICLLEYLTGQPFEPPIQIFGTDASNQNIQKARAGIFPESIAGEVSPERLRRFFVKVDKGFQVSKRVRDLCIFARQNLSYDPPFSKMDLISCRNVLIYLGPELQRQILPTFHYALRPNGFLLLGTSETIREFTELFQQIDRKHKFFMKIGNSQSRTLVAVTPRVFLMETPAPSSQPGIAENWGDIELQRAADRIVLARYGPPGVIVDEKLEILQSRGHTATFMEMPQGSVSLQLTRMLRDTIATSVTQVVRHAIEQDIPVRLEGLRIGGSEPERDVTLEVLPIHTTVPRARCFLVLFVPANQSFTTSPTAPPVAAAGMAEAREHDQTVERLRQDLASTKLYLQTLLDERDAKNQELVSANEEIQSANEEMQSTNEELETTKEELQSSNEELQTVNDELQQRNATLTQTTNDLSNLLNSVNLPVLMLNNELHIRHFTPPTQRLMNLRAPDIGRPFSEIRFNLNTEDLAPLFGEVLETLAPREIEVQDNEGKWYLLRVRPYRTTDNKIEGVVVVLVDIDQLRRSQQELRGARDFARSVIENVPLPLAVVDRELRIRSVNDAFRTLVGAGREDLEKRSFTDLAMAHWGLDEPLRSRLQMLPQSGSAAHEFDFEYQTPEEPPHIFHIRARLLPPDGELLILITIEDITPHKEVERLLGLERERLTSEVALTARELGRTQDELRALAGSLFTSQEDERRRVARELHDDIAQRFAILEIETQNILAEIGVDPAKVRQRTEHLRTEIAAASNEIRRIAHALHPSALEDLGITPALGALVENFRGTEHMIATFSAVDVPSPIPIEVATGLYRIAQEALRNATKHAGRAHVKVLLRGADSGIRLQVTDSGEGFDPQARRTGLGLISMEERARLMGGSLNIESKPGEGTRITVEVPLHDT
ncbi:MAG TPA: CheR family methyltransferase [Bryobacteraceae bacterium]|nr:CheR family methyltransferase [Bryobacteraceae bacterium]